MVQNVGTNVINTDLVLSVYPYQVLKKVASNVLIYTYILATYFISNFFCLNHFFAQNFT